MVPGNYPHTVNNRGGGKSRCSKWYPVREEGEKNKEISPEVCAPERSAQHLCLLRLCVGDSARLLSLPVESPSF